jgi:hypothetical protein
MRVPITLFRKQTGGSAPDAFAQVGNRRSHTTSQDGALAYGPDRPLPTLARQASCDRLPRETARGEARPCAIILIHPVPKSHSPARSQNCTFGIRQLPPGGRIVGVSCARKRVR